MLLEFYNELIVMLSGFLLSPLVQVLGEALGIFPELCTAGLFSHG